MCYNGLCMRQVFGGELAFVFAKLPTLAVMHYVLRISLAMHASSAMAVTFRNLAYNLKIDALRIFFIQMTSEQNFWTIKR